MKNNLNLKTNLSQNLYLIRGVAIVLVVIGHVIGYNRNYGMRQIYNSDLSILGWVCDFINTFHMPIFFVASGIAFTAFSNKDISYKQFFTSKIPKLLIPLVIWCPVYFISQSLSKAKYFSFVDVIQSVIYPYEIFWFLHVLIFINFVCFIYFKNFKLIFGYVFLSVILFIISVILSQLSFQLNLKTYFFWNLFYAFGVLITKYLYKLEVFLKNKNIIQRLLLPYSCLVIMLIAQHFIPKSASVDYLRIINGIFGFIFMYSLSIELTTNAEKPITMGSKILTKITEYFVHIGKLSIAIYLFHGYFTGISKALLLKVLVLPNPILYFTLLCFTGVLGPIIIYETLKTKSKLFIYSLGGSK